MWILLERFQIGTTSLLLSISIVTTLFHSPPNSVIVPKSKSHTKNAYNSVGQKIKNIYNGIFKWYSFGHVDERKWLHCKLKFLPNLSADIRKKLVITLDIIEVVYCLNRFVFCKCIFNFVIWIENLDSR